MPAWSGAALGVKLVTVMPGNSARGVGTVQATYLLLDRATGEPRAVLDGEALTLRRTAATSALAARYLARDDAQEPAAGRGRPARPVPGLRPLRAPVDAAPGVRLGAEPVAGADGGAVAARSRTAGAGRRATGARRARSAHHQLRHDGHGAGRARGLDRARRHLDLVGGFTAAMREVDDARRPARESSSTPTPARWPRPAISCRAGERRNRPRQRGGRTGGTDPGERRGRTSDADVTLFKSVGTALRDLAAATLVVRDT